MPRAPFSSNLLRSAQRGATVLLALSCLGAMATGYLNFGPRPYRGWLIDAAFLIFTVLFLAALVALLGPQVRRSTHEHNEDIGDNSFGPG